MTETAAAAPAWPASATLPSTLGQMLQTINAIARKRLAALASLLAVARAAKQAYKPREFIEQM